MVINTPVYYPFFSVVAEAGRELVEVPLAGAELDVDGIDRAFAARARALILCSPHNPTGSMHLGAIGSIAAFCDCLLWLDGVLAVLDHNRALLAQLLA